jgi:hypothetical protein
MPLQAIERYLTEILLSMVLVSAIALGPSVARPQNVYVSGMLSWVSGFAASRGPAALPIRSSNGVISCVANRSCQPN